MTQLGDKLSVSKLMCIPGCHNNYCYWN